MAPGLVQFRFPEEKLAKLRENGIDPTETAREALEGRIRQLVFRESMLSLSKIWVSPDFDPVQAARESRADLEARGDRDN